MQSEPLVERQGPTVRRDAEEALLQEVGLGDVGRAPYVGTPVSLAVVDDARQDEGEEEEQHLSSTGPEMSQEEHGSTVREVVELNLPRQRGQDKPVETDQKPG